MNNFVKQFPGSEYMYPAARAYRKEVYDMYIANVKQNPAIADWLDKFHSLLWYRSAFNPSNKCDYVTNNIAEVFNNWIKDYKDLLVCDLADKIRLMIMQLFHKRRRIGRRLEGKILPSIIAQLNARTRGLGHLEVIKGDDYVAEVRDNIDCVSRYVVKAYLR
jgi:aryl carrier-like protein